MPRVTIGLPVYNGALLINECLENLRNQTYTDFEVIISDNASTDGTSECCADFAAKDSRFRHIIHKKTSTANDNFLYVRNISDSDYFAFRAFDDLSSHGYVADLVQMLDNIPNARLAVGRVQKQFGGPHLERGYQYPLSSTTDHGPALKRILRQMSQGQASWFYGVWRRQALVESFDRVIREYDDPWGCDHLILLHAMLNGGICGTRRGARFTQRILQTKRHYIPAKRPSYDTMVARNKRFHRVATELVNECGLDSFDRSAVTLMLPLFTLKRCHGTKRLAQGFLKKLAGRDSI